MESRLLRFQTWMAAAGATVEGGIPGARRALLDAIDRYGYGTERS